MRIVFMGTPDFAVPSLQALLDAGHEVAAVYTQPDKPQGRKQILTAPPVKEVRPRARHPGLSAGYAQKEEEQARLRELAPEVIIVVAYGKLLPKAVLDIPPRGCINVHGSLLPRWRGAAPIQWAVIAGDEKAGVTTMLMAEGLDTGDMLLTSETPVGARETAGELFDRLAQSGAELLTETLVRLDEITPRPQNDARELLRTYARQEDGGHRLVEVRARARLSGARPQSVADRADQPCRRAPQGVRRRARRTAAVSRARCSRPTRKRG